MERCTGSLDEDQIAPVKQSGDKRQQIPGEVLWAEFVAAAHQQRGPGTGEPKCKDLSGRGGPMREKQPVNREYEAASIPEKGRIPELGHANSGVPGCKIERIENRCNRDRKNKRLDRPMRPLAGSVGNHEQEGQSQREPPEAGGHWAHVCKPYHPRAESQGDIAD